ncbi:MAG: hypothetical protein KDD61_11870 [Bdellovibrionales bacterium]|nr:hypothetical protein [Bdellovibrionales bacterium]
MKRILIFSFLLLGISVGASAAGNGQRRLALAQGISLPDSTSIMNFSSGFTFSNPAGVIYQEPLRLSVQGDQNGSSGLGAEVGTGGQSWGLAAGYYSRDCTGCEGDFRGAAAVGLGGVALGIRFEEELSGIGLIFNQSGGHRLGIVGQLSNPAGDNNNITALGVGYAYSNGTFEFSLDGSTRTFENTSTKDDRIFLSPGIVIHTQMLSLSLNYETLINDKNDQNTDEEKGNFWFGLGFGQNNWHLAAYADYFSELAVSFSWYF